jgi:DNA-binding PadR family transcriptional regulator
MTEAGREKLKEVSGHILKIRKIVNEGKSVDRENPRGQREHESKDKVCYPYG